MVGLPEERPKKGKGPEKKTKAMEIIKTKAMEIIKKSRRSILSPVISNTSPPRMTVFLLLHPSSSFMSFAKVQFSVFGHAFSIVST